MFSTQDSRDVSPGGADPAFGRDRHVTDPLLAHPPSATAETTGLTGLLATSRDTSGIVTYDDLGATVHRGDVPACLADELPDLYSTLFATKEYIAIYDDPVEAAVCTLTEPKHVLLFSRNGDTIEVLNKVFTIAPVDAERACRALFRAFPKVRRIHLEVMFSAHELRLPRRALYATDHMVVELPDTVEAYTASLGKSTRRTLRAAANRLRRDFPDATTEVVAPGDCASELFAQFLEWKTERFRRRGQITMWEDDPGRAERFVKLVERRGEAHITSLGGHLAAIAFVFPVGRATFGRQSAADPSYEDYRLDFLCQYWVACDAVRRGKQLLYLGWGNEAHKTHLGARPRRATSLSVFRGQASRLASLGEAWTVARRTAGRRVQRDYWRGRHAVRRALEPLLCRARDSGPSR